jgi:hypothetical protein
VSNFIITEGVHSISQVLAVSETTIAFCLTRSILTDAFTMAAPTFMPNSTQMNCFAVSLKETTPDVRRILVVLIKRVRILTSTDLVILLSVQNLANTAMQQAGPYTFIILSSSALRNLQ